MEETILDLSGVVCPMTWMQTRSRLSTMTPGAPLRVIVDEGKPARELPRSAKAEGHRVCSVTRQGNQVHFLVECAGLVKRASTEGAEVAPQSATAPGEPAPLSPLNGATAASPDLGAENRSPIAPGEPAPASPLNGATAASPGLGTETRSPGAQSDLTPCTSPTAQTASQRSRALRRYASMAELIGNTADPTPLVQLNRVRAPGSELFLKLEWMNPFGSIKDRTAKYLLEGLRARGQLEGRELVEPSSGNTGIALVALANLLGIRATITIPDAVPEEKRTLLRLLGATVWPTPDNLCPIDHPKDGAIALAHAIAAKPGYLMANQYENPDNVRAHYETTGPEIWQQTEGKVRVFVAGYGTCGTLTGCARYLKEQDPSIRIVAIEPQKNHRIPGLKSFQESKRPAILDSSLIDETLQIDDASAYCTAIRLAREESILAGPSTGAIVAGALQVAERGLGPVVALSPDSAFKYVSFFQEWVGADGHPPPEE